MSLPEHHPFNELAVSAQTTSMGTTPVAAMAIAPKAGLVARVFAASDGTFTGTIDVAVTINGGATDIAGGALTLAAGSGVKSAEVELELVGTPANVNEGDVIIFTPSGGTGTSIPGAFTAMIR